MTQIETAFRNQYPDESITGISAQYRTIPEALGERGPCDLFLIDDPAGYVVREKGQTGGYFVGFAKGNTEY